MYGPVSREHRRITVMVRDTARITNGITACITARITAKGYFQGQGSQRAQRTYFQSTCDSSPRDDRQNGAKCPILQCKQKVFTSFQNVNIQ